MARLGQDKIARDEVRDLNTADPDRTEAIRSIAIQAIARAAVADPLKIAELDPIAGLGDEPFRQALDLDLVADTILHKSPWGAMDAGLSSVFRPKVVRRGSNATLTFILKTKLPAENAKLSPGEQEDEWNDIANDWLELGDKAEAEDAAEKADSARAASRVEASSTVWRTWVALGNYDRAVQGTSNLQVDVRGPARVQIAEALTQLGLRSKARLVLVAAYPDFQLVPGHRREQALLGYVEASIHAGDAASARTAAEQMAALAARPQLFQADALIRAAAAYNDLEDREHADALLGQASARLPGNNPNIGPGGVVGDVGPSMRADLVEQLQRAGDKAMFEVQYRQLPASWKARVWSDICDPAWPRRPADAACENRAGPPLLLQRATHYAVNGDNTSAAQLLPSAITGFRKAQPGDAVRGLLTCARLAFAIGRTDETELALTEAARVADHLSDVAAREVFLADVAALRDELIP